MSRKWESTENHWSKKYKGTKKYKEITEKVSKGWSNLIYQKKDRVKCKCLFCGKEFEVKKSRKDNGRGKFCSKKCFSNYRNILIDKECSYCKKKFKVSRANKKTKVYCSKECFSKGMSIKITGKKHSKETRKKISKFLEKRKYLETTRKKMSKIMSGKRNPSWLGGTSFEPYGLEFNKILKEQIRKRDGYRCQQCFRHQDELYTKTGQKYKLPVHHIDYNKKNNDQSNLISLCGNCHGQTNFGREDWMNYFRDKLKNL